VCDVWCVKLNLDVDEMTILLTDEMSADEMTSDKITIWLPKSSVIIKLYF